MKRAREEFFVEDAPFREERPHWVTTGQMPSQQSYAATNWAPATKKGAYASNTKKYFPEAVGTMQDTPFEKRLVCGPFTPVVWEEIPLGNREAVKQIPYRHGWRGELQRHRDGPLDEYGTLPAPGRARRTRRA